MRSRLLGWRARRGQGLLEYSVILALVAIVVALVVALMGRQIQAALLNVVNTLQGP
jgi:Flp pilus assembly pilin Flp